VQRLRVEKAVELLETTSLGLDDIARRVGYAEPSTLRKLLRRDMALGARALRATVKKRRNQAPVFGQ
jgi:transcriptional regulator GlxA family with amidase domain